MGDFDFRETKILFDLILTLKEPYRLIDVFDKLSVSKNIPFIKLNFENKKYYKLYRETELKPSPEWFENIRLKNYIVFWMLEFDSKKDSKLSRYTKVIWTENNYIKFDTEDNPKDYYINILKSNIDLDFTYQVKETGINGFFTFQHKDYHKYILADLITVPPLPIEGLFYLDEFKFMPDSKNIESIASTALQKKKFYIHYGKSGIENDLTAIITPVSPTDFTVTVQKSRSREQLNYFLSDFAKLLQVYDQKKNLIKKFYDFEKKEVKIIRETKKTKLSDNLDRLRQINSSLFPLFYSTTNKDHQPQIVETEEEAEELRKQLGTNRVLKFQGNKSSPTFWYTCNNPSQLKTGFIYPGIKQQTKNINDTLKKKLENLTKKHGPKIYEEYNKWIQEFPFLPQCYKTFSEKKNKDYLKFIGTGEVIAKKTETQFESIKSNKICNKDQPCALPPNVSYLFEDSVDYKKIGSPADKDSLLYCMSRLYGKKFQRKHMFEDFTDHYGNKISYKDALNVTRQEMLCPLDDIIEYINGNKSIEPTLFIRYFELRFHINIFLFEVNDKHEKGNVLVPVHEGPYFYQEKDLDKDAVVILCFDSKISDVKYQCEIVSFKDKRFVINDVTIKKNLIEYFNKFNQKLIINEENSCKILKPYIESKIFSSAKSQGIDNLGKTFLLNFDTFSLFIPPIAPLPIKESNDIKKATNLSNFNILGKTSDGKSIVIKLDNGFECYVPVDKSIQDSIKDFNIVNIDIFFDEVEFNSIEKMKYNKTVANILKHYVLFMSANQKIKYSVNEKINYPIIKNIDLNNKSYISNGKLVVKSENMKKLLDNHVLVTSKNKNLERFGKSTLILTDYSELTDFKSRPNQILFNNVLNLLEWFDHKDYKLYFHNLLDVNSKFGYFFKNGFLNNGKICIIQNVDNWEYERALNVAYYWHKERMNLGFNTNPISEKISEKISSKDIQIYDTNDLTSLKSKKKYNLIEYEEGYFAAVLFF